MDTYNSRFRPNRIFIPDIVNLICAEVDVGQDRSQTLSRLARTSHFFHESALDFLWRDITGIYILINCMPPGLWEESTQAGQMHCLVGGFCVATKPSLTRHWKRLTRAIIPSDWLRLMSYARRVKKFDPTDNSIKSIYGLEGILMMYQALDFLTETTILLPNINILSWNHSGKIFPYILYFMGPKLSSLSIGLDGGSQAQISFLHTLRGRHPHICKFALWSSETHIVDAISDAICGWNNLQTLSVSNLQLAPSVLVHLANLTSLKSLEIRFDEPTPALLPDLHGGSGFPSLEVLTIISGFGLTPVTTLVETMSNSPLREFDVDGISSSMAPDWRKIFSLLNNHCNHSSLKGLNVCNDWSADIGWGHDELEEMMTIHCLRPLLAFTNLTRIRLIPPGGFDFDDDDIIILAKAWPQLEDLVLGPILEAQHHPRPTLSALVSVAEFCPNISRLSIVIDASTIPSASTRGIRNHNLVRLGVRGCPIESATDIAAFLADVFPEIEDIGPYFDILVHNEETERVNDLWDEVQYLIPMLSSVHRQEHDND